MTRVRCIEKCRNKNGSIVSYKLQHLNSGKVELMSAADLKTYIYTGVVECVNLKLLSDGRLCSAKEPEINLDIQKLKFSDNEIRQYARSFAARQTMMGQATNLEIVFDNFLALRKSQGIVYTDAEQYHVYSIMQSCYQWGIQTLYVHERYGGILFQKTNITEGTFTLRGFVTGICRDIDTVISRHFPAVCGKLKVINQSKITNMEGLFANGIHFDELDLSEFDTKKVTNMSRMFRNCAVPTLDLRSFDTSNVTDMSFMFSNMHDIRQLDISSFDTRNVTNMGAMFSTLPKLLDLDLSHFNTSNVRSMQSIFNGCGNITHWKFDTWDTSKVKDMRVMFAHCLFTNAQIRNLNTSSCVKFSHMFASARVEGDVLDLRHFDTSHATELEFMFENDSSLKQIDFPSFRLDNTESLAKMFQGCSSLKRIDLDFNWGKTNFVDGMFADCWSLETLFLRHFDISSVISSQWLFGLPCENLKEIHIECRGRDRDDKILGWFVAAGSNAEIFDTKGSSEENIATLRDLRNKAKNRVFECTSGGYYGTSIK